MLREKRLWLNLLCFMPGLAVGSSLSAEYSFTASEFDSYVVPQDPTTSIPSPIDSVAGSFAFTFETIGTSQRQFPVDFVNLRVADLEYSADDVGVVVSYGLQGQRYMFLGVLPGINTGSLTEDDFILTFVVDGAGRLYPGSVPQFRFSTSDTVADWSSPASVTLVSAIERPSVPVPEPAAFGLLGLGFVGLGFTRRRAGAKTASLYPLAWRQ